jgi:hypothetical protein
MVAALAGDHKPESLLAGCPDGSSDGDSPTDGDAGNTDASADVTTEEPPFENRRCTLEDSAEYLGSAVAPGGLVVDGKTA